VRHEETGFLVPHGDVGALAASIARVAGDRALVERLGAQARSFATTFTWERAALETAQHLDEVIQAGG
jgi:glycosyltransferase involved in cell wall biosynthesis